jgi:outer membrane protein TolC
VPAEAAVAPAAREQAAPASVRRISVEDAVSLALEQNLGVQVARVNPRLQDLSIAQVRAAWLPNVTSSLSSSSTNLPVGNILEGASGKLTNDRFTATVGLSQQLPWGGSYAVDWNAARSENNNIYATTNPTLGSSLSLSVRQSLLRNFTIDSTRQQLQISRTNREITDLNLRQTVLNTTRNVRNGYWELSYAVSSLAVQGQSLELAQESLKNNRARVAIGTMAPIDIIEAQAEVAQREESVIVAEAAVSQAEDRLRALVFDPKTPDFWSIKLELTDAPTFEARAIDVDAAVDTALTARTDIVEQRKSLEANDINIRFYRNQTLPDLNLQASYGVSAQGGKLWNIEGFPEPQVRSVQSEIGYGSVFRSLFARDFPQWAFGVQVGYPLGRSSAEAGLARATLQREQANTQIRNLELQIATQVRDLGRQVNTNRKRVEATRASRELAEKRLEAEQKKFAAGMSTSFYVFQAQRDLAQARNSELRAILDYNRSLVDFETGQQAPVGGGGGGLISTGGN